MFWHCIFQGTGNLFPEMLFGSIGNTLFYFNKTSKNMGVQEKYYVI